MNRIPVTGRLPLTTPSLSLIALLGALLLSPLSASAQRTYMAIDLTPASSGAALSAVNGLAAGYTGSVPNAFSGRATLWTGDGPVDLHPPFLDGPSARSAVSGMAGSLQVGYGAGLSTGNRNVPLVWSGSAAGAVILNIPFTNAGGQANATDGVQIVGSAIGLDRDGLTLNTSHAMIWTVATGQAVDIGTDANLYDVAGGQQVGMVVKKQASAALWQGTKAYTLLHPRNAVTSVANATDGFRQAGYAGFDIRVRQEAAKGNKEKRFTYAYLWSGSAASAVNIHPYLSSADNALLENSYALDIAGEFVAGYATDPARTGTPAYNRAVVWDATLQAVDLNAVLPAGFIGSQAYAVDSAGNVAGVMTKADGTRHAVLWVPVVN